MKKKGKRKLPYYKNKSFGVVLRCCIIPQRPVDISRQLVNNIENIPEICRKLKMLFNDGLVYYIFKKKTKYWLLTEKGNILLELFNEFIEAEDYFKLYEKRVNKTYDLIMYK